MRGSILSLVAGLAAVPLLTVPVQAQFQSVFATPLPPGPGSVPLIPNGRMVAPVLMPVCAPTAQPVAIYQYPAGPGVAAAGGDCGPMAAAPCADRFWISGEFLYATAQGPWVPPLVTFSPAGTPAPEAGGLFRPTSVTVLGGEREGTEFRPGLRVGAGYWLDPVQTHALEATFFYLGDLAERVAGASGPGGLILARPAVNGLNGTNIGIPAAGPFPGGLTASVDNRFLGGDLNYRRALGCGGLCRVDLLAGYRYLHLGDTVDIWQTGGAPIAVGLAPLAAPLIHDSIRTRNYFHGPQLGAVASTQLPWGLNLELTAKLAMGVTVAHANLDGETFLPGGQVLANGVLVGATNRGVNTDRYFAVVPEAGLKLGCDVTERMRLSLGYTFLYWSQVRRAPEQIDLTLLAPGRPTFRDDRSDYWIQGWTAGLQLRF